MNKMAMILRVAEQFKLGTEFDSEEALKEYLRKHPKADPKKHSVKKKDDGGGKGKGDADDDDNGDDGKTFTPSSPKHKALAETMSSWHSSGSDVIYQVSSNLYAKKPVPRKKLEEAADRLESFIPAAKAGKNGWGKTEVKELTDMVKNLRKLHKESA